MNQKVNNFKKYRYAFLTAFILVFIWLVSIPVRNNLSKNYNDQGDRLLAQRKFVSAELAYNKSKLLSNKYGADSKIQTAKKAETDLETLKNIYRLDGRTSELNNVVQAMIVPEDEVAAVKNAKRYLEQGDFRLAIASAKTATEMDKGYRDAWTYLGIANLKGAVDPEISKEGQETYKNSAKEAFLQAQSIDPANADVAKYLSML